MVCYVRVHFKMVAPIDDNVNVKKNHHIAPFRSLKYFFWTRQMLSVTFIVKVSYITGFSSQTSCSLNIDVTILIFLVT